MNDVSSRAVREFSEFLDSVEKNFPKPISSTAKRLGGDAIAQEVQEYFAQ